MFKFQQSGVFNPLIITQSEAPRLLALRYYLFNVFPATLHTWLRTPSTQPEDAPCRSVRDRLTTWHIKLVI